jgi:hypothetical protein
MLFPSVCFLVFRFFLDIVLLGGIDLKKKKPIGRLKETSQQYAYRAEELGKIQRRLIRF